MKVYKIVFSPTGGTQRIADIIAKGLGDETETVDLSDMSFSGCSLEKESAAVIALPSFGGRAPKIAVERLKKIEGNGAKAVSVAVYGNRAQEDTLIETADAAKECGFEVIAGIAAVAEHSIARQYASGRPDEKDAEELNGFAAQIAEKLKAPERKEPDIPGNRPYKKEGAELNTKICEVSAESVSSIEQINTGVEKISDVVRTNAATAGQSAAASEELSGQAHTLKSLVDEFRLG